MAIRALYIHIPFCRSKCAYCDFDSAAVCTDGARRRLEIHLYLEAVLTRLGIMAATGAFRQLETAYIGGGTPTVAGDELLGLVQDVSRLASLREFTCEANPESFSLELAQGLKLAGVTRVSLGIQSFEDAELKSLGRIHSSKTAADALSLARSMGFSVSGDLMCGIPLQDAASWRRSVDKLIASGVDHVSVYPLTLEAGTQLEARSYTDASLVPDEDFQADCMEWAAKRLRRSGFKRYEVASYALPGCACKHNRCYWMGESYMGIGRSAAGMLSGAEFNSLRHLFPEAPAASDKDRVRFVQRDEAGSSFDYEVLSPREAAAEDLMLACRTSAGISPGLILRACSEIPLKNILEVCETACRLGLARWEGADSGTEDVGARFGKVPNARLVPTDLGWLQGNVLFELFWDLA